MGRRGPRPKDPDVVRLQGCPGHRKPKSAGVPVTGELGTAPRWLSPLAKLAWKRLAPELQRLGRAGVLDRTALAACCQAVAELELATQQLDQEGRTQSVPILTAGEVVGHRVVLHPAVRLQKDALTAVRSYLADFGLNPSARSRVPSVTPEPVADPLAELTLRVHAE